MQKNNNENKELAGPANRPYTENMSTRISALLDIVFKFILGTEKSTELLKSFVNAVQKDAGFPEIESVIIKNPFNDKTYQDAKLSVIDVRARDNKGDWYNIEVQLKTQLYIPERSLYYWAKKYADQLEEGREYMHLNKVISINLMDFTLFPEHIPFHSCYLLHEKDNTEYVLTLDLIMHYLEIPKIEDILETDVQKWLYFLRHAGEEDEKMEVLLKNDSIFREADKRYKQFTADEQARMAAQARSMFLHDQANRLWGARQEGKAEEKTETARKLLARGMATEDIADITGLPIEEIKGL